MNKGLLIVGVAAAAGIGIAISKANAASGGTPSDLQTVTGDSGTTYGVRLKSSIDTPEGIQQTFEVYDVAGLILAYAQYQGNNDSRILVLTPEAPHPVGDPMWQNAVQDFAIFTSIPGLNFQ